MLIDFGDASVFEAIAYPSIILDSKTEPKEHEVKALNWEPDIAVEEFPQVFQQRKFLIQQKVLTPVSWYLGSHQELDILQKIQKSVQTLKTYLEEKQTEIRYGVLTGHNPAFIINESTKNNLIADQSIEIIKPIIKGEDVTKWTTQNPPQYLICIKSSSNQKHPWSKFTNNKKPEEVFKDIYPSIYNWFESFGKSFKNRGETGKFYWELRSCSYWNEFMFPKIIYPDMSDKCRFSLDNQGIIPDCTVFSIPNGSKFLLGVLNSKVYEFFFKRRSPLNLSGYMRFKKAYLLESPIPIAAEPDRLAIESLVQKCLDAKGQGVEEWEAEIDDRVAHLYGLTAEDMKIIRGE